MSESTKEPFISLLDFSLAIEIGCKKRSRENGENNKSVVKTGF
jgi:hypothetical protein